MTLYVVHKVDGEHEFDYVEQLLKAIDMNDISFMEDDEDFCRLLDKHVPTYCEEYFKKLKILLEGGIDGAMLYAAMEYNIKSPKIFKGDLRTYAQTKIAQKLNLDFDDSFILKYINFYEYELDLQKEYKLEEFLYLGEYYVVEEEHE